MATKVQIMPSCLHRTPFPLPARTHKMCPSCGLPRSSLLTAATAHPLRSFSSLLPLHALLLCCRRPYVCHQRRRRPAAHGHLLVVAPQHLPPVSSAVPDRGGAHTRQASGHRQIQMSASIRTHACAIPFVRLARRVPVVTYTLRLKPRPKPRTKLHSTPRTSEYGSNRSCIPRAKRTPPPSPHAHLAMSGTATSSTIWRPCRSSSRTCSSLQPSVTPQRCRHHQPTTPSGRCAPIQVHVHS